MTRGRAAWLSLLLVGAAAAWALRRPSAERSEPASGAPRPSPVASAPAEKEVEVELASPHELEVTGDRGEAPASELPEAEVVRALEATWDSDAEAALRLAEQAETRFGESSRAAERRLYEIKALVKLGRIGRARSRAERYLARHPSGPMTNEVERLTGVHRRPDP